MQTEIKCPSCSGWRCHFIGCEIGTHGQPITKADREKWARAKQDREEKAFSTLYDVLVAEVVGNSI